MGCSSCGARYRSISNVNKANLPIKYTNVSKPSKTVPVPTPIQPSKVNPQLAVGLMSSIANSMPK